MRNANRNRPEKLGLLALARLRAALDATCGIMDRTIRRHALGKPISVHGLFGSAIVSAQGDGLLAMGRGGHPLHGLTADAAAAAVMARLNNLPVAERDAADSFILNDPYLAGLTPMDIRLVRPVRSGNRIVAMLVSSARWKDLAQAKPGLGLDLAEAAQEGLRLPGVRLAANGRIDPEILAILLSNTRAPHTCLADLHAQSAALTAGAGQLLGVLDRTGPAGFQTGCANLLALSAARANRALATIEPASATVNAFLPLPNRQASKARLTMAAELRDGRLAVDLSASDPPVDVPINCAPRTTLAALHLAFLRVLPGQAWDSGSSAVIDAMVNRPTVAAAVAPAPVSRGGETLRSIVAMAEGLFRRLAGLPGPGRSGHACTAQLHGLSRHGTATIETWLLPGGRGAMADAAEVAPLEPIAPPDIERLERDLPIAFETLDAAPDTAGPGADPGETGMRCVFTSVADGLHLAVLRGPEIQVENPEGAPNLGRPGGIAVADGRGDSELAHAAGTAHLALAREATARIVSGGGDGRGSPGGRERDGIAEELRGGFPTPRRSDGPSNAVARETTRPGEKG